MFESDFQKCGTGTQHFWYLRKSTCCMEREKQICFLGKNWKTHQRMLARNSLAKVLVPGLYSLVIKCKFCKLIVENFYFFCQKSLVQLKLLLSQFLKAWLPLLHEKNEKYCFGESFLVNFRTSGSDF